MKYEFIGWCSKDGHDKVYAVLDLGDSSEVQGGRKYATVWGRRGKKLQHKIYHDWSARPWTTLGKLIDQKMNKGYDPIGTVRELSEVYPEFETDLERVGLMATLRG